MLPKHYTKKRILAVFLLSSAVLVTLYHKFSIKPNDQPLKPSSILDKNVSVTPIGLSEKPASCPGVLSGLMNGTWKTRPLTKQENDEMFAFLFNAHSRYRLPTSYQRRDGFCGNVTFIESKNYRALCDPRGKTPCCFHNKCALKTASQCECEDCYDLRNMKHAEHSKWIPSHPGCTYHEHSPQEACDILDGMDIAFVGDSLIRHVYIAMLLVLRGNKKDGALSPGTNNETRKLCEGMNMFTEKLCRVILNRSQNACDGNVSLHFNAYYHSGYARGFYEMANKTSFLFAGIGIHDGFNHKTVQNTYLKPTLSFLKSNKKKNPHLLWVLPHAPGILKSPIFMHQTDENVKRFNKQMKSFLKARNIPIFDTYDLTEGMMSFDGQHYGLGINIAKANLLLSYIRELKAKNKI